MALEQAFDDLCRRLHEAYTYFYDVRLTVTDAEEGADTKALVGGVAQELSDLMDNLDQARRAGERGRRALRQRPPSIEEAGRTLSQIQDLYWGASRRYVDELVAVFKVDQLRDLAQRNPRFTPWSETVIGGLEGGRAPMHETGRALHACWSEALERALTGGVAVYAVGQQIGMEALRHELG